MEYDFLSKFLLVFKKICSKIQKAYKKIKETDQNKLAIEKGWAFRCSNTPYVWCNRRKRATTPTRKHERKKTVFSAAAKENQTKSSSCAHCWTHCRHASEFCWAWKYQKNVHHSLCTVLFFSLLSLHLSLFSCNRFIPFNYLALWMRDEFNGLGKRMNERSIDRQTDRPTK